MQLGGLPQRRVLDEQQDREPRPRDRRLRPRPRGRRLLGGAQLLGSRLGHRGLRPHQARVERVPHRVLSRLPRPCMIDEIVCVIVLLSNAMLANKSLE